jgi:hypothetical protein
MSFELPRLVRTSERNGNDTVTYGNAPFEHHNTGTGFEKPLYRLQWPRESEAPTDSRAPFVAAPAIELPMGPLRALGVSRGMRNDLASVLERSHRELAEALPYMPETLQYEMAVNRWWSRLWFGAFETDELIGVLPRVGFPVGPLSDEMANDVLDGRFALEAEDFSELEHLGYEIERLLDDPIIGRITGVIGESERIEAVSALLALWFSKLEDHLYCHTDKWWKRDRKLWAVKAQMLYIVSTGTISPITVMKLAGVLNRDSSANTLLSNIDDGIALMDSCQAWMARDEEAEKIAQKLAEKEVEEANSYDEQSLSELAEEEEREEAELEELMRAHTESLAEDLELAKFPEEKRVEMDRMLATAGAKKLVEEDFRSKQPDGGWLLAVEEMGVTPESTLSIADLRLLLIRTLHHETTRGIRDSDRVLENMQRRLARFTHHESHGDSTWSAVRPLVESVESWAKEDGVITGLCMEMLGDLPTAPEVADEELVRPACDNAWVETLVSQLSKNEIQRNAEIVAMAVVRSRGGHDEHEAFVRVATAPTIPLGLREPRVIYDPDK